MNAEQLLRNLGATGNLKGFRYAVHMIEQTERDPEAAIGLTKRLYPETGKQFHVSPASVERNMRTVIRICWNRGSPDLWTEIAGMRITCQPTNGTFLDMAGDYLRRQSKT